MDELYHPQYVDRNVGPKDYRSLQGDMLLVTHLFLTVQGEGPYTGWPAVFLRLAGCNRGDKLSMGCQFCDTDFRFHRGVIFTFEQLRVAIASHFRRPQYGTSLLVVTGGEPMIQDHLSSFLRYILDPSRDPAPQDKSTIIQIESNGDRLARGFPDYASIILVVSPKVTRDGYHTLSPEVAHRLDYLKILVDQREGSPYHQLPTWLADYAPQQIYLSPITVYRRPVTAEQRASIWDATLVDQPATRDNYRYALALALRYGYKISLQTHLFTEAE